jgi:phosphatidate phosphatase APP1
MLNTFRRMESDEMPGSRLRVRVCGVEAETETDAEGFFALELDCRDAKPGWHDARVELLSSPSRHEAEPALGELLIVEPDCALGIVSDLDDTVIATGARNKVTHTRILLVRDALEQVAFPGVAEFYRLLMKGADGNGRHPVFYVSRSSWGLYDLFVDFMESHDIPRGPTFLMDAAVIEEKSAAVGHENHKLDTLAEILEMHARMRVVLIGDSGQHDPEAYLEAVRRWPKRVRAVYLRDVTRRKRDREVKRLVEEIERLGVPAAACETTEEMARHAERLGLIPAGSSASIGR